MPLGSNLNFKKEKLMRKTERSDKVAEEQEAPAEAVVEPSEEPEPPAESAPAQDETEEIIPEELEEVLDINPLGSDSYLVFGLHDLLYAVEVENVREIFWLPELTPVEEAPPYIVGIVNVRGNIIPVMDLDLRFGRKPPRYELTDNVIVLDLPKQNFSVGIIVNKVWDVQSITTARIEKTAYHVRRRGKSANIIRAEAKVEDQIIMLLNQDNLVPRAESVEMLVDEDIATQPMGQSRDDRAVFCPEASEEEREIFRTRAKSLRHSLESQEYSGLVPLAVVGLNGEYFGVDLDVVREFSDVKDVTPIPCCPAHIVGSMNLRGDILTLVDIRQVLKMPMGKATETNKVIVVRLNEMLVGIVVNMVFDVVYIRSSDITTVPAAVQSVSEENLRGTAPYHDKMLSILDLRKILESNDIIVNEDV